GGNAPAAWVAGADREGRPRDHAAPDRSGGRRREAAREMVSKRGVHHPYGGPKLDLAGIVDDNVPGRADLDALDLLAALLRFADRIAHRIGESVGGRADDVHNF